MPTTASTAGRQLSAARIPLARAEQSFATRSWSSAPKRSEDGAIRIRVAAVMLAMLFGGVFWGCDGPHVQSRSTAMRDGGDDSGNCWRALRSGSQPRLFAQENDFLGQNGLKTGHFLRVLITIS